MPNFNKVILVGNMTRDPELKHTPNNKSVANFGVAVNHKWKNSDGETQNDVTFVDCDAWGRTAEVITEYFQKGKPILVEGRLKLDQWQDRDGNNRSKLKVVVERFEFVGDNQGNGQGQQTQQTKQQTQTQASGQQHVEFDDDEIPF